MDGPGGSTSFRIHPRTGPRAVLLNKIRTMPILGAETSEHPANLLSQLAQQETDRRWWAVYTLARQEKAFARQLVQFDIPFYLPLVPKNNLIRGRRVQSYIPLFSGYVFLFGSPEERIKSLTTNRVSTILPVDDQNQLSHDLRHVSMLIETNAPLTIETRLAPGDPVRIRKGPMEGIEGIVITRRGQTRLLVAVRMLQQGVSVEIDDFILEPLR
jgi:transcriptional antiterminator RfaH